MRNDYFADNYYKIAEDYFNDDVSSLSDIGEFVLNNPELLRAFIVAWSNAGNTHKVQDWWVMNQIDNDEEKDR